jgi:hypothetical protein
MYNICQCGAPFIPISTNIRRGWKCLQLKMMELMWTTIGQFLNKICPRTAFKCWSLAQWIFGRHQFKVGIPKPDYKLLRNLLGTSWELLENFLGTSWELLGNCLETFCTLHMSFLQSFYKLLANFFKTSLKLFINFLCTSYKHLMSISQTYYQLLMNLFWTSIALKTYYEHLQTS